MHKFITLLLLIVFFLAFAGCKKDENPKAPYPPGSNQQVNQWVLDSMQVYYYWNRSLPGKPDMSLPPVDFFSALRNSQDRFSRLVNPNFPDLYYQSLAWSFAFDLVAYQAVDNSVAAMISLVIPGSGAERSGLKRGDVVDQINGTQITASNISQLAETAIKDGLINLHMHESGKVVSLSSSTIRDQGVHNYRVISINNRKTAYLFYNEFNTLSLGPLRKAFAEFKQQQVSGLVIDLRYNIGGDVAVAAALAALIAPVQAGNVFAEFRGNANAGVLKRTFTQTLALNESGTTIDFEGLAAQRLAVTKVVFLTGRNTASAAELLINCLKPYTSVVQIGENTYGKDVASFAIRDYRNPVIVQDWQIDPVVFKLYNADGKGDYTAGLIPDIQINELSSLPLKPFGNENDPLLAAALAGLTGKTSSVKRSYGTDDVLKLLYDSRSEAVVNETLLKIH